MEKFKKYVTHIKAFSILLTCITLFKFYSITSPVLFTKNSKLWNERKEDFLHVWLLQHIMLYQRSKLHYGHNRICRHTYMCKQPKLTK